MYIPSSNLTHLNKLLVLLAALLANAPAWALSSDKDQPIEIEADTADLNDQKRITIYRGDVIVIQGSIRMTGDKMTVYYNEQDDVDTVIMEGTPATYKQLPDNSDVYDEAEALRMEYYEPKGLVVLIDNAVVKQGRTRFSGNRVEYDTNLSQVKARGDGKEGDKAGESEGGGRFKMIIKPKDKENEKAE